MFFLTSIFWALFYIEHFDIPFILAGSGSNTPLPNYRRRKIFNQAVQAAVYRPHEKDGKVFQFQACLPKDNVCQQLKTANRLILLRLREDSNKIFNQQRIELFS